MPRSAPKICTSPGCSTLVIAGRCQKHALAYDIDRQASRRQYDKQRGSNASRGYDAKWRKARIDYLLLHPVCACGKPSEVVDHIIAHKGDQSLFWDESNWSAKCQSCHNRKTAAIDGGFGNPIK